MLDSTTPLGAPRVARWRRLTAGSLLALLVPAAPLLAGDETPAADTDEAAPAAPRTTFVDTVTVASTRSERARKDTPGQIDVVDSEEIAELGHTGIADLVRFMPGVYVEGDLTRLGSNGFTIRGVGGNRVLTQVDGIPTAEQFDFGPLGITQFAIDLDTLERAEVVRSAGSALYGSDALGGVVSLVTRSPRSYLGGRPQHVGLRAGYDGRGDQLSESLTYARGNARWSGSAVYVRRDGAELDNQGQLESDDATRTAPNPIDRRQDNLLVKVARSAGAGGRLELALEWLDGRSDTEVLSARAPASPFASAVFDADAVDRQERRRLRAEHSLVLGTALADSLLWRAYYQQADTEQRTVELRDSALGSARRDGLFTFDQETLGLEAEARKALGRQLLTYGLQLRRDRFDGRRDRSETAVATGAPVPTTLTFPTKYFPASDVGELGLFAQGELTVAGGRLRIVSGLRFDRFDLDPDRDDAVFITGNPGQPEAVAITDQALSPKLGLVLAASDRVSLVASYARGFRAPPMSAVNNGFTNPAGGYRTLPNPSIQPETSDNLELGLRAGFGRGSVSVTAFENRYDDFIETVFLGFNPTAFLVEFQPRNVERVEIAGIELAADLRFGDAWRLRAAYSFAEGDNVTAGEPLETIAPPRLVAGLRYAPAGGRWGLEAVATAVEAKAASDLPAGSTLFRTPAYEVVDLAAWFALGEHLTLQLSAWNLGDETYWQWAYARGQSATSTTLDRYTSPGRSFGVQARARF